MDNILVVGDDGTLISLLRSGEGGAPCFAVTAASGIEEAIRHLEARSFCLMIACDATEGGSGIDVLRESRRLAPGLPVWIASAHADPRRAQDAMMAGADDYLWLSDAALPRLPWRAARLVEGARGDHPGPEPLPGRLLRAISHDLRGPLAALDALLQMMESGADGGLTPPQAARLQRLRDAAGRIASIANDIADLCRAHDGRLTLSPSKVDLAETAALAARQVQTASGGDVGVRVAIAAGLPHLRADAARLRQALGLLLAGVLPQCGGSALELTAEASGGSVELRLREVPRPLPVEAAPPELGSDRLMGALGISLARELVRLHGGELRTGADAGDMLAVVVLPIERAVSARSDHPVRELPR